MSMVAVTQAGSYQVWHDLSLMNIQLASADKASMCGLLGILCVCLPRLVLVLIHCHCLRIKISGSLGRGGKLNCVCMPFGTLQVFVPPCDGKERFDVSTDIMPFMWRCQCGPLTTDFFVQWNEHILLKQIAFF